MAPKVKTRKLSDGTIQIGYSNAQGWIGLTNIYRLHMNHGVGWKSDSYSGIEKTITDWKTRIQKALDEL